MAGRLYRFSEAQKIAWRAAKRSLGNEGTTSLPTSDEPLIYELLHRLGHRELADAPILGKLRFARNAHAGSEIADLLFQAIGDL